MASLQDPPEDVKHLICQALYRESSELVRPLWQVSKAWRVVAEPFVYKGLALAVGSEEVLREDAKKLRENEFAKKYLEHARYIHLTSSVLRAHPSEEKEDPLTTGLGPIPSDFSLFETMDPSFDIYYTYDRKEVREVLRKTWEPIISLLGRFKHLSDIVVQLHTRIPPDLVAKVTEHHPKCKLHLREFRFRSLHHKTTDPDERALATSPNLHALSIRYMLRDSRGVGDHNEAAALRTVTLAPNIKHVRMLGCDTRGSRQQREARNKPLEPWRGFMPAIDENESQDKLKPKLETLAFTGFTKMLTLEKLERWEVVAGLSSLKALFCAIGSPSVLHHISISHPFPSLVDFTLELRPSTRDLDPLGWNFAVENFFTALNPLQSLALSGTLHGQLLATIAERHGDTLRDLSFSPYAFGFNMLALHITAKDMEVLAAGFPKLTTLSLTLKRSMGDRTETKCYETIGTLPNLRHLKLQLDCTNPSLWHLSPEPHWDDFEKTTQSRKSEMPKRYNGHLKRAILNSALDETLARQIWSVVNSTRGKNGLRSMEVKTDGGSMFDNTTTGDLLSIVNHVSRTYRISRVQYGNGDVDVVELSSKEREEWEESKREADREFKEKWGKRRKRSGAGLVFDYIWPHGEDEDWRDVWRSWPLETQSAEGGGSKI